MLNRISSYIFIIVLVASCSQKKDATDEINTENANKLINETSPYLLQHAYNPVDWRAWNEEALQLAKDKNKLIIISVGYSACHWCHVMEEESFENDSVAKLMNENFVNIKVDREERPDIDQIYMNAVQLMTGRGGWPLNCIALPDGRPVFGGTYFTKQQWTKILEDMSNLYKTNPDKVIAYAEQLTEGIKNSNLVTVKTIPSEFDSKTLQAAINKIKESLDYNYGGKIGEPKFPMPSVLNLLLRYGFQTNNKQLQDYVFTSLKMMANGGIYDQIGGGFSRYSVDEKWHIPHFEKMLYDNAQLVSVYSKAYQLQKEENFKTIVEETLSFIESEMSAENGSFFSALDADSKNSNNELEEGVYYVWTKEELQSLLNKDLDLFKAYYNINGIGKWEKDNYVLYKTKTDEEFLRKYNLTIEELKDKIKHWKLKLKEARNKRNLPRKDDKALTSWNAVMLKAYVDAYRALGKESYLDRAVKNANFIKQNQIRSNGSIFHNYKNKKSSIEGFSEDYAHTISAFIELYQVTLDEQWLNLAKELMEYTIEHFLSKTNSMFYFTSDNETNLITRKFEVFDNVIPSSNSVLANCLFKLGHYYSDKNYSELANQMLTNVSEEIIKTPSAYSNWLALYLNYANPYYEVAISGKEVNVRLEKLYNFYIPNILISGSNTKSDLPLLKNKFNDDETLIYVCVNGTCKLPVNTIDKALSQILK
jgi:uncharacterized protein YyaL (SSP411 family)